MNAEAFRFTPQVLDTIRSLAGTMPARDIADRIGCGHDSLRSIASRHGISLKIGDEVEPERPGADDRVVARIDAMRPRFVQLDGIIISAEVMTALTAEATIRQTTVKALVARLASYIAIDGLVAAVLDER